MWAEEKFAFMMRTGRDCSWILGSETIRILLVRNCCTKKYFILEVVCIVVFIDSSLVTPLLQIRDLGGGVNAVIRVPESPCSICRVFTKKLLVSANPKR